MEGPFEGPDLSPTLWAELTEMDADLRGAAAAHELRAISDAEAALRQSCACTGLRNCRRSDARLQD